MSEASLADVLPAAALALDVPLPGHSPRPPGVHIERCRVVIVLLVDGLGQQLLRDRGGHAPFLRRLQEDPAAGMRITSGFPSTTATSMGMLGTGLPPGAHGLVGLDVLDPDRNVMFNELAWDPQVDPRAWQPEPTLFEVAARDGVDVVRIGPAYFDGSGLTEAALRGGRFIAAAGLQDRLAAAAAVAGSARRALVYVYWGELDKVGHEYGSRSWQWAERLAAVDAAAAELARSLPADCQLLITADHGMVDVPLDARIDVADEPSLAAGIRHVGGEARALHLYCEPGSADRVLARWRDRLGAAMEVLPRDEAVRRGWFGPVSARVLPRIGDVVVAATGQIAVVDSRTARPEVLRLIGLHGARTDEERLVPLLLAPTGWVLPTQVHGGSMRRPA